MTPPAARQPVRHVYLTPRPDGRLAITGPPDPGTPRRDGVVYMRVDLTPAGAERAPAGPVLTGDELNDWLSDPLANGVLHVRTGIDAGSVVATPPPKNVSLRFGVGTYPGPPPGLACRVVNVGREPLASVGVEWKAEYDTPQPDVGGGFLPPGETAGTGVDFWNVDGRPTIPPGGQAVFHLPAVMLRAVLSEAAALSPSNYRLRVTSGEHRVGHCPGSEFSAVLDRLEAATA